jgi:UDP-N-acetylmuramate--alanine ligase
MDIYPASEPPIEGVSSFNLFKGIEAVGHKSTLYIPSADGIVSHLLETARPGDVIITQGAGSVWKVGTEFLKKATEKAKEKASR